MLFPMAQAVRYSFYKWNGLGPLDNFVGFDNYREVLDNDLFRQAVQHNLAIVVLSIVVQLPLGLGIALLLNRDIKFRGLLRTIIFVPYVLAEVVAGVIWQLMLQPDGPLDVVLQKVGLGSFTNEWLGNPDIVLYTLMGVLTWKYLGFAILLFLAGLQGVPQELHEAAAIDGASWWQIQRRITIPLLGPTIRTWIFLSMIGSLQLFDMVKILMGADGNGPANSTVTMATFLVSQGFKRSRYGYGSAAAVVLLVISLTMALIYQRLVLRRDNRDD
ncbi:MAG: sugar ABC transporter permease [Kineosporiaceae bacterium]